MRVLQWLRLYWYIPVILIVAALSWVLWRRRPPTEVIQTELDVIRAGTDAQKVQAEVGAAAAAQLIREKYVAKLEALDAEDKTKMVELESDPVALARFLERVSR
jgi:hypothetical protein